MGIFRNSRIVLVAIRGRNFQSSKDQFYQTFYTNFGHKPGEDIVDEDSRSFDVQLFASNCSPRTVVRGQLIAVRFKDCSHRVRSAVSKNK